MTMNFFWVALQQVGDVVLQNLLCGLEHAIGDLKLGAKEDFERASTMLKVGVHGSIWTPTLAPT